MDNSSRASNSQNESNNINTNNITITVEEESPSTNKIIDYYTELPEPAIVRIPHSPKNQILDEIPPPPYHLDMQFPIQSHSRYSSPPEYTAEYSSIITTQPLSIPSPSFRNINGESQPLHSLKSCKICQESDEDDNNYSNDSYHKGKLISPCKCKGSLQYVHTGCLNKWRYSNVRSDASYRCEVCKYEYKFYRPRIAKIFSSYFTLHFLSLLLLFTTIYFFSLMVKYIDTNNNRKPSIPPENEHSWKNTKILDIKALHWFIGTSIISLLGLIFFMFVVCCNGFRHTRNTFCYCGGCNDNGSGSCCPSGSCSGGFIGCDGGGGDCDCAGFCVVMLLLMMLLLLVVGFFSAIIAAYLFIQKVTSVCLERIHDRILEVKKD